MAPTTPMTPARLYIFDYLTNDADLDDWADAHNDNNENYIDTED